jgi:hypothetical protein
MKLENKITRGLFVAPKLYWLQPESGETVVKARGVGADLTAEQFESLFNLEAVSERKMVQRDGVLLN